jgi:hypothetical protein
MVPLIARLHSLGLPRYPGPVHLAPLSIGKGNPISGAGGYRERVFLSHHFSSNLCVGDRIQEGGE